MNDIFESIYFETIILSLLSGAFVLMLFTLLLFSIQKNPYMKYWGLFWVSTTLMFLSLFVSIHVDSIFFVGLYLWFVLLAGYFLYKGCYLFINKKESNSLHIIILIFALIILPTILFPDWIGWGIVFAFLGYGLYLFSIGKSYLSLSKRTMTYLGIIMIVFSVFSIIYPFILFSTWFLNYGYLLFGILGLFMGISLYLVHFQKERQAFISVQNKLEYLIMHDPLTNLYNRAYMSEVFNEMMNKGEINVGLLFIDMNDFKLVNDRYGHRAGDESLVHIAIELKELFSNTADVCRFGGDEFVMILRDTTYESVKNVQELILKFHPTLPYDVDITLAAGVSFKDKTSQDIYTLLDEAEREMYSIKQTQKS
ncbi:MAG: GGDEF domain-containing protein [Candidatus Izemoplasmataceae bacterium]